MPDWRSDSRTGRYGLAVLAVLAAAACRWGLVTLGLAANLTFGPFYAALVVAALYGGVGAGAVALALSAPVAVWTTAPLRSSSAPASLVVFLIVGSLIVWLSHVTRLARQRAERAEHRVQTCLDSIGDAFVAVDFSWRYTYVNEAAQAYFSKTEAELIGRNCWEVFPQALGTPLEMYYRQVMAQRQRVTVELPSVVHAGKLINDMLDVSRIVTGKLVFHLATLPLGSMVRETIDELGPQARAKGLEVQLTIDGDLWVVADRERVRQVVSNLFTNAVKFTPAGGAVHLSCVECDGMAQLDVRDTGHGIAAGLLPTIFERFRQADTSSTRHHEGLGLGLAITKYIVDHLGGTITATSPGPGQGSRFSVRLPFAGTKRADDGRPGPPATFPHERPVGPPAPAAGRLSDLDVLVVDDHRDTVELIAFVLVREGAAVRTAMSAPEALAAWQAQPADVLVTDLSMPGMDGFALLGALHERAHVPAIALSGLARADDRQRALQAGFAAHLAKPVEPAILVETVARINAGRVPPAPNADLGIQH